MDEREKWDLRAAGAARSGLDLESVDLVMLPAHSGKTVARRDGRVHLLRHYLREQLDDVAALPPIEETASPEAGLTASTPLRSERVCAMCRGHCCRKGGDHGFISPSTLQRVLAANPAVSGDALIDTYVSHVPARSYAGSCIYHGASGCALPRALRSEVCTSYLCTGLKTLSESASQHPERVVVGVFEPKDRNPPTTMRVMAVYDSRVDELRPQRRCAPNEPASRPPLPTRS
jgi:hypothetical protein